MHRLAPDCSVTTGRVTRAVWQDALAVQGTLRAAFDSSGERAPPIPVPPVPCVTTRCPPQASRWMTHCSFGSGTAVPAQVRRILLSTESSCIGGRTHSDPSTNRLRSAGRSRVWRGAATAEGSSWRSLEPTNVWGGRVPSPGTRLLSGWWPATPAVATKGGSLAQPTSRLHRSAMPKTRAPASHLTRARCTWSAASLKPETKRRQTPRAAQTGTVAFRASSTR
jgi:hypothetical protein